MPELSRRDALRYSIVFSTACAACGLIAAEAAAAVQDQAPGAYYVLHKAALRAAFREIADGAQEVWQAEFGADRSQAMARAALAAFDGLIDGFPDVGGEKNWDTQFIPVAGWYVALYPPMRSAGKTAEDVGKLIYDLYRESLEATPKEQAAREGEDLFGAETLAKMEAWARWTQQREYPANWVATFVRGDGRDFDYGYDYSECGLVKYFRSKGVPELAPYVCLNDFLKSAAIGSGLRRTKTIAQGDGLCDFRYKKGRPVAQDWDTEIDLIRSRAVIPGPERSEGARNP